MVRNLLPAALLSLLALNDAKAAPRSRQIGGTAGAQVEAGALLAVLTPD